MRKLIRRWLSIEDIIKEQVHQGLTLSNIETNLRRLNTNVMVQTTAVGHAVAKLDPGLARSDLDPAKQAESKAIGDEIIKKLQAEQAVRDAYGYTPKGEF